MFLKITMYFLVLAMLLSIIRLLRGPTVWDRLLALNLISVKIVLLLAVYSVYVDNMMLLDISISYGIVGFMGIALITKFVLEGGRLK